MFKGQGEELGQGQGQQDGGREVTCLTTRPTSLKKVAALVLP
jgi:hypothetical protein